MKHGWLKLTDRLVRIDRVHEFYVERVEGGYVVKAAIFGEQDVVVSHFSTYEEAEDFLNRVFYALRGDAPMIDVVALREGWDDFDYEDYEDYEDFFDDDEDDGFPF